MEKCFNLMGCGAKPHKEPSRGWRSHPLKMSYYNLIQGKIFIRNRNLDINGLDKTFQCHIKSLENLQTKYFDKYDLSGPKKRFSWQKSFHFRIVDNKKNFLNHIQYLENQWIKHNQKENKYCYIDEDAIKEFPVLTGEDPNLRSS